MRGLVLAVRTAARRFRRAEKGVAAVEFALVFNLIMIPMYFGLVELTVGLSMDRKMTAMSRSLADLTSRASSVSTADLGNIFAAASSIMQPYDSTNVEMVLTSVLVKPGSGGAVVGSVDWSCLYTKAAPATLIAHPKGSSYAVPDGYKGAQSFILVETRLKYTSVIRYLLPGTYNLNENTDWPVRNATQVNFTGGACPTPPA